MTLSLRSVVDGRGQEWPHILKTGEALEIHRLSPKQSSPARRLTAILQLSHSHPPAEAELFPGVDLDLVGGWLAGAGFEQGLQA
jgi:hypothetical protein